jgi:hypothetical protein
MSNERLLFIEKLVNEATVRAICDDITYFEDDEDDLFVILKELINEVKMHRARFLSPRQSSRVPESLSP